MSDRAILALDIATVAGWAYGAPGSLPLSGTERWAPPSSSNGRVGAGMLIWLSDFLKVHHVDAIYFEAPFDPRIMAKKTNFNTTRILVGLPFLLETLLEAKGYSRVFEVSVSDVRKHFLGKDPRGDEGKRQVQLRCRQLGWKFNSADAADALAVWSFACAIESPKTSIATAPLFQPRNQSVARAAAEKAWPFSAFDEIEEIPE